jgi:hypothetical protein
MRLLPRPPLFTPFPFSYYQLKSAYLTHERSLGTICHASYVFGLVVVFAALAFLISTLLSESSLTDTSITLYP